MRTRRAVAIATGVAAVLLAYYAISWAQVTPSRERGTDFSASYVAALLLRSGDGSRAVRPAARARPARRAAPGGDDHQPAVHHAADDRAACAAVHGAGSRHRISRLVGARDAPARAGGLDCDQSRTAAGARRPGKPPCRAAHGACRRWHVRLSSARPDRRLRRARTCCRATRHGDSGRNALAGFWLGLAFAATKPHLAIGLGVWLVARRDWRALAGAATGCALVAAVSLALVGPAGIGEFVSALGFAYGNTPASSTVGVPGLIASWFGTERRRRSSASSAHCSPWPAVRRSGLDRGDASVTLEVSLAGAAALSLVASPHLLAHDLVILAPVFAWCAARAAAADAAPWPGQGCRCA